MINQQELLEQIADDERDFAFALRVFDGDLMRLQSALLWQASDGLIEIRRVGETRAVTVAQLKALWCDDANFLDEGQAADYVIRLTTKGQRCTFS